MSTEQFAIVKVMVEQTFALPVINGKTLNGYTVDELMEEWFKNTNINAYHASRNSYKVGGGDTLISYNLEKTVDVPEGTI